MKKTVFITGGTGIWGTETLKLFAQYTDSFHIRVLVRESKVNQIKMEPFQNNMEIVWGDMQDTKILRECVRDADYVLAVGALVSPMADAYPEETMRTNYGSTLTMLKAIKEFGQQEKTRFVYVGTVAQTGDRQPPIHWGRVGDPMKPAIFDYYALSKVFAERAVIDSGLKYWVSIRQTGMMPGKPASAQYPIASHQPPNNVIEWSNAYDSAKLLLGICQRAPEEFWRKCYNLSGGAEYRQSAVENCRTRGMELVDLGEPNWFGQYNFHGQYFLDGDELESLIKFRTLSFKDAQKKVREQLIEQMKTAGQELLKMERPTKEQIRNNNKIVFMKPGGTLRAIADHDENRIRAWYGSEEKYKEIPTSWEEYPFLDPDELRKVGKPLSRGFDESKKPQKLEIDDMRQAAEFRGGECLSESMEKGNLYEKLVWKCAQGHIFEATPYAVLYAGHWCEECMSEEWRYGAMAKENPFFAQVWNPLHKGEKIYNVKMEINPIAIGEDYK